MDEKDRKERGILKKILLAFVLILTLSIGLNPISSNAAIADGTYDLPFQVNKPDSSSASMANDYFLKPAKLIVSNGTMKIQVTIKNSAWVTEFNPPGGGTVISSNPASDRRVVQFNVSSLNTIKVPMKIDIDDIDYHHSYTVDFVFNGKNLPQKQEAAEKPNSSSNEGSSSNTNNNQSQVSNNSSSNNTNSSQIGTSQSGQASESKDLTENDDKSDEQQSNEEVTSEEEAEEEPNPETSDSFPYYAVILLFVSVLMLVSKKKLI